MWPEWAAMAASWGRRKAQMQVALVWVPPTKKCTSASGRPIFWRMRAAACSQWGSQP